MEFERRSLFPGPGEDLLVSRSALDSAARFDDWLKLTGHDARRALCDPVVSVPLPVRSAKLPTGRRWPAETEPGIMWHPLMWLPDRVALRYRLHDEDGNEVIEDDTQWAVRVALEVTQSGLYDPATGTWLDVLSTVGLDAEDSSTADRVRRWLSGEDDAALDSIDLSPIITLDGNREWALEAASEILPVLQPATWALVANDLITLLQETTEDAESVEDAADQVNVVANLAIGALQEVPPAGDEPAPPEEWQAIIDSVDAFQGTIDELLDGPVEALTNSLYSVRDDYWPAVAALLEDE